MEKMMRKNCKGEFTVGYMLLAIAIAVIIIVAAYLLVCSGGESEVAVCNIQLPPGW